MNCAKNMPQSTELHQNPSLPLEEIIDKVRRQIAQNALRQHWIQPVVALANRLQRTYLSKSEFRSLLQQLGVQLPRHERHTLWRSLLDELSSKLPLDVFIHTCITHPGAAPSQDFASSAQRESSVEGVSKALYLFLRRRAVSALAQRLARVGRRAEPSFYAQYDLYAAFKGVFFEERAKGHLRFGWKELDSALRLCGYRGSLEVPHHLLRKVFLEMDSGRRGFVDFHSFGDWFIRQEQRFGQDAEAGEEEVAEEGESRQVKDPVELSELVKLEGCWKRLTRKKEMCSDAALQWALLDHLRTCQDEGCFEELVPEGGVLRFREVLFRCRFKERPPALQNMLERMLRVDDEGNLSWERWKELLNTRSMFHPDSLCRDSNATSFPTERLSGILFQSRREVGAQLGMLKYSQSHRQESVHFREVTDKEHSKEAPKWHIDNSVDPPVASSCSSEESSSEADSQVADDENESNLQPANAQPDLPTLANPENTQTVTEHLPLIPAQTTTTAKLSEGICLERARSVIQQNDEEFEEKDEEWFDSQGSEITRWIEITAVSIKSLTDRKTAPAVLQSCLLPWGIRSSITAQSERDAWSCWSDSRRTCRSMGATMKLKYPQEHVPITLNPSASKLSKEGRVWHSRPHVLIKLFRSLPKRRPFARRGHLRLLGQSAIPLGRYINAGKSMKNQVETVEIAGYRVDLRFSWVEHRKGPVGGANAT